MSYLRPYHVSPAKLKTRHNYHYTYCQNLGLGLAMWDTAETYEDLKYLSTTAIGEGLLTALDDPDNSKCDGKWDCDGKLVWRQTQTGPRAYFQANTAYNEYK